VLAGIEILGKLEQLNADRAFFQSAARPADGVSDDILEELPAAPAGSKCGTLEQTGEFRPHCLFLRFG
jgi:hypothetical protein